MGKATQHDYDFMYHRRIGVGARLGRCPWCGALIGFAPKSKKARYCSDGCRKATKSLLWVNISKQFLKDHPQCVLCGRMATQAHHIVPIRTITQRTRTYKDHWILEALCADCHRSRHNISEHKRRIYGEKRGFRANIDAPGWSRQYQTSLFRMREGRQRFMWKPRKNSDAE